VADLVPGIEWMVGQPVEVDYQLHRGELEFEALAALVARAKLVYCSPGFAVVLAQAVGCPSICVFGGYENGTSYTLGARFTPHLPIEPIRPCLCFQHNHNCQKAIDLDKANKQIEAFLNANI
jgi:ADP-heptose:LPS heptosyltransferase